ncbi:MAG: lipoprotein [Sphingobacteriaceae bacterium]|nr:lipoprotein [Sphingobacteriaceae bacterium]
MKKIFSIALAVLVLTACKKDPVEHEHEPEPTPAPTVGNLMVEIEAKAGTDSLIFDTKDYVNANLDSFKVTLLKYYLSNIVLTKSDNSTYKAEGGYFLIDHKAGANKITLSGVPIANYKSISFLIGVDSLRNVSGAQDGALATSNGMFWSWSSGYIFAKMEGSSPKSIAANNALRFHVGGFSGANNALRTATISFGTNSANVSGSTTPAIHLSADIKKWFTGANTTNFATTNVIHMPGTSAVNMSANYVNMFTLEHIHN